MSYLLLELFGDEIPAKMQQDAVQRLFAKFSDSININFGKINTSHCWVTPKRLGFYFEGFNLSDPHSNADEMVRGPKINAPDIALDGFLNKYRAKKEQLLVKEEYYYLQVKTTGHGEPKLLLRQLVEEVLNGFVWPKSMRWNIHNMLWVRPLKSMIFLLDDQVFDLVFGHIKSSNFTFGHRFHAPDKIIVNNYDDYKNKLYTAKVIIDADERKNIILKEIEIIIKKLGLLLIEDIELLKEIVGLVEYPVVYLGNIAEEFMSLPKQVLILTLKHHQRYLMLQDKNGNIAPYYIIISNISAIDNGKEIIRGNNRVLQARLNDAKFFVEEDKKHKLITYTEKLKSLTFHQKIGTLYDKVERVKVISGKIASKIHVVQDAILLACNLAKADLVTNMVREFPELQGIMGHYYALNEGTAQDVALAIEDHYKPQGPHDSLPSNITGAIVAIADKIDTLNQMFANGIKPTGSKDPFALRRAALGIIRIILHYNELQTTELFQKLISDEVRPFILERARILLEDNANQYEIISKLLF